MREAILELLREVSLSTPGARESIERYSAASAEDPAVPSSAPSYWFVTCFSGNEDDLSQWRAYSGGENGYAIGFRASTLFGHPNSLLVRVNYDGAQHRAVARDIAKTMFDFYRKGVERRGVGAAEQWASEFFPAFSLMVDNLAPMVKHSAFRSEGEYRIVHHLQDHEMARVKFKQKATLMSRHFPLTFAGSPMLPISRVMIGPSRHKAITRVSVDMALRQRGYSAGLVWQSEIPYQQT
jgi:hypothetical protein